MDLARPGPHAAVERSCAQSARSLGLSFVRPSSTTRSRRLEDKDSRRHEHSLMDSSRALGPDASWPAASDELSPTGSSGSLLGQAARRGHQ
eukprot:s431_g10.t2